ncbi:hypothetical protein MCEZE4_00159 [Burkholderiaceae bacterium]
MRTYLTSLLAALALVACGGGNDVASSGATTVSAAAPSTPTTTTTTEPKVNGQVDERTGVTPVAAQATIGGTCSNNGVTNVQAGLPCFVMGCMANSALISTYPCQSASGIANNGNAYGNWQCVFLGGVVSFLTVQQCTTEAAVARALGN